VEERYLAAHDDALRGEARQLSCVSATPIVRMRANPADLGVGIRLHSLSSHGHQMSSSPEANKLTEAISSCREWSRIGERSQGQHVFRICVTKIERDQVAVG